MACNTISTISFSSVEPNEEFLSELKKRNFNVIVYLPPKKARKNARYPTSKYGTLMIEMDRELAHTVGDIATACGVDFCIGGWSSHVVQDRKVTT